MLRHNHVVVVIEVLVVTPNGAIGVLVLLRTDTVQVRELDS